MKKEGRCYQCKVRYCKKCDADMRGCEECKDNYELKEGKCQLSEMKMSSSKDDMSFEEFKKKYGKKYKDKKEEIKR